MNIESASENNLEEVISWVRDKEECRTWAGPDVSFPIERSKLSEQIAFTPDNSYICISDNSLVAFGQIFIMTKSYSHMARIITNPEYRGQGFGRAICSSLVEFASKLDSNGVSLNVYRNNVRALSLYQSLGFQEQSEKSDEAKVYMVKA